MSKLFEYREKLNLTQDELAEKSGVSVRTIQRIEAGSALKGHTLKVIALALNVDQSELNNSTEEAVQYNYTRIKLINLSSLFFFIPLCNILFPLLIMQFTKEKNTITKQLVSVQIMWTILSAASFIISPFLQKWFSLNRQLILVVLMVCFLVNIYIILRNTMELDKKKSLRIKLSFSII
ncbi:MAG: transcriptional regulator with XRE-family HTH domain [Crocinitomicaceae bacterium]|jgi:transcriptional regulator with XRE-family HTH domain